MATIAPSINFISPLDTLTTRKQLISTKFPNEEKLSVETKLSSSHRIWWSNVVVETPNNLLQKWEWNYRTIAKLSVMVIVHILAMFAPFYFNWGAFWVAIGLYVLTGWFGITLSFHRNLTHKSYTIPKWLEYLLAYFGSLALQADPIDWVRTHRYHHKFVDSKRDPHSPLEGFWYSHIIWVFDYTALVEKRAGARIVTDLETQQFYRFMKRTYVLHHLGLGYLLFVLGGFPYVVWGMGVRTICFLHATWCVNSVCHVWGNQAWNTGDLSKNNWWVAMLTAGEGWHNNHHAFEYSARQGLEWWQIDVTWYIIKLLESIGLAKDVKLPTEAHKQRMALKTEHIY